MMSNAPALPLLTDCAIRLGPGQMEYSGPAQLQYRKERGHYLTAAAVALKQQPEPG